MKQSVTVTGENFLSKIFKTKTSQNFQSKLKEKNVQQSSTKEGNHFCSFLYNYELYNNDIILFNSIIIRYISV